MLRQSGKIDVAAYAFGGMISSFVNMLVFAHFAIAASEQVALTENPSLKRITTGVVKIIQVVQCILCLGHAAYALAWVSGEQIPKELSW